MEQEFEDFDSRNKWNSVYQEIRNKSNNFEFAFADARRSENRNLNRYRDVNPFDHSRVSLNRGEKDYINASLVKVPSANRSYILTQGPLPITTGHFWLMVWEQNSKAILMLNRLIEKQTVKCHRYWPIGYENGGMDELVLNEVGLMVTFLSSVKAENYTLREFSLTDFQSGKSRTVLQFHYTTWPDFGVPESPEAFLNFLMAVRKSGALEDNVGPSVVHCSAGIGRSGTFCLVDSCLVLVSRQGSTNGIDIRQLLLEMRRYRMGLIQTADQLRFSYLAIIEGSKVLLENRTVNNIVPCADKIQFEPATNNKNESESESSDEGVVTSEANNSTPPPLPPRPARITDSSPGFCNSLSESSPSVTGSLDVLIGSFESSHSLNDQNGDEHCKTPITNNSCSHTDPKTDLPKSASSDSVADTESATELRKRQRIERSEKTAALVQTIRKKQKESELWQNRRSILKRISLGLVVLFGTSVFVYRYCSKS